MWNSSWLRTGAPLTAAQEWASFLKSFHADRLRIRAAVGGEQPKIETTSAGPDTVYHVTGILTAGNQLQLPGGTFGLRDKGRLQDWISRLAAGGGGEAPASSPAAFGLSGGELVAVHDTLAVRVAGRPRESQPPR